MPIHVARLHVTRTIRQILLDLMDDESLSDAEFLELSDDVGDVVDALFEQLGLEVTDVLSPGVAQLVVHFDVNA